MAQQAFMYDDYQPYGRERNVDTVTQPRMYVHSNVHLPYGEIDARTGMPVEGRTSRGRTQAKRMEYDRLNEALRKHDAEAAKPFTMSLRTAILLVAAVAFVLGMMVLSTQETLTEKQKTLSTSQERVTAYQEANDGLREQIADAAKDLQICVDAVNNLQMVPSDSVQAIRLEALDPRPTSGELPVYDVNALQGSDAESARAHANGGAE